MDKKMFYELCHIEDKIRGLNSFHAMLSSVLGGDKINEIRVIDPKSENMYGGLLIFPDDKDIQSKFFELISEFKAYLMKKKDELEKEFEAL